MPLIPQDLLKVMISRIGDKDSLKSLSLVSSAFCEPSQRILLRSLSLADHPHTGPPTYSAAHTLLEESPHIASYITRLYLELPRPTTTPGAVQNLKQILGKLKNLDECIITSETDNFQWRDMDGSLAKAILTFLSKSSLRQLHVLCIDKIPLAAFVKFLGATSLLALCQVTVSVKEADLAAIPSPQSRVPDRISLEMDAQTICTLLARTQFTAWIAGLRDLKIIPYYARTSGTSLVRAAAATLTRLRLDFTGYLSGTLHMPFLPALTTLDVSTSYSGHEEPWFRKTLLGMLAHEASPALTALNISFFPLLAILYPGPLTLDPRLATKLDSLLSTHDKNPRITWRLSFFSQSDAARYFDNFVGVAQRAMPLMHGHGRCFAEKYKYEYGTSSGSLLPYAL
ncbi:hypothetical protein C8R46DRAFT_1350380 [Mycena filopes]|nr:hypothetical protein C8R46DRAFT_1350380 [Mycena filopes]